MRGGEGGAGIFAQEFVDNLGKKLVRYKGRIVLVTDYNAGDAFTAAVGVEGVGWMGLDRARGVGEVGRE